MQLLIRELYNTGLFAEAKRTTRLLERPEDVHRSLAYIAREQARSGQVNDAYRTANDIDEADAQDWARLEIAQALTETNQLETARKLADFVTNRLERRDNKNLHRHYRRLAYLFGRLGDRASLENLFANAADPTEHVLQVQQAILGGAEAQVTGNR